jgi:hypothetical protein
VTEVSVVAMAGAHWMIVELCETVCAAAGEMREGLVAAR